MRPSDPAAAHRPTLGAYHEPLCAQAHQGIQEVQPAALCARRLAPLHGWREAAVGSAMSTKCPCFSTALRRNAVRHNAPRRRGRRVQTANGHSMPKRSCRRPPPTLGACNEPLCAQAHQGVAGGPAGRANARRLAPPASWRDAAVGSAMSTRCSCIPTAIRRGTARSSSRDRQCCFPAPRLNSAPHEVFARARCKREYEKGKGRAGHAPCATARPTNGNGASRLAARWADAAHAPLPRHPAACNAPTVSPFVLGRAMLQGGGPTSRARRTMVRSSTRQAGCAGGPRDEHTVLMHPCRHHPPRPRAPEGRWVTHTPAPMGGKAG